MVIAVLEVGDGVFEVLSTAGDTHLGGDDFDKVCVRMAKQYIILFRFEKVLSTWVKIQLKVGVQGEVLCIIVRLLVQCNDFSGQLRGV